MNIYVDADACPNAMKEIIYKFITRKQIHTTLIANQFLRTPNSKYLSFVQVPQGFDEADNEIVKRCQEGDLVISNDIPLSDLCIQKGAVVLSFAGEFFDKSNISNRLAMRNFMDTLRSAGVETGGPSALSNKEKQNFANQLNKIIN